MVKSANQGWRDYWKSNRPASCVPANDATAGEIAAYWVSMFAELPDGVRILDIATGNGVLLAHATIAASTRAVKFELTGVDIADIDPQQFLDEPPIGFEDIRFIGKTAAEKLPFAAEQFDVVVSQYGLEYAQLDKAIAEAERVLSPGGRLVWLAHCENSEIVLQNRDQSAEVDYLLAPRNPIEAMERFVASVSKGRNSTRAARRLQAALTEAENYCRSHPPAKVMTEVCTVIAESASRWQAYRPDDLTGMLADSRQRLNRHRQRINDLIDAVLSPDRLQRVEQRMRGSGWQDTSIEPFRAGTEARPIGLLIRSRRQPS